MQNNRNHRSFRKIQNAIPFEAMGFIDAGRALIRDFDSVPSDPSSDCQVIDAWAQRLGLADWYRWAPFSA